MKRISTLLLMLMIVIGASAQKITAVQALEKAERFALKKKGLRSKGIIAKTLKLSRLTQQEVLNDNDGDELYVYNIGNDEGFVIVSGDERVPEILGYSNEGSINPDNMPDNMRWLLQMYANEIKHLEGTAKVAQVPTHPAIAPMLTCKWDQDAPYNAMCPRDNARKKTSYTGCIATAMAQVLYHVRPAGSSAIAGYSGTYYNNSYTLEDLPATTFNWNILRNTYQPDDNDASAQEVAKLMRYCGQAAKMKYSGEFSGANHNNAWEGLKQYLGISKESKIIYRENFDKIAWDGYIYRELSEGRVILLGGSNFNDAHAFVCDGYDGSGLYHINWGWGGTSNSYFEINHLNPDDQGIGGSDGGFSIDMHATVNIKLAAQNEEDIVAPIVYSWNEKPSSVSRSEKSKPFNFNLDINFVNWSMSTETNDYDVCWGLYDNTYKFIEISEIVSISEDIGYFIPTTINCNLGANLDDGKYYLMPLGRQKGATRWKECNQYCNATLIMNVNGNNATLTELPQREAPSYIFSNMTIDSNPTMNVPTEFSFTAENVGVTYSNELFILVDGEAVTSFAANIDPSEKETFNIGITFKTTGKKNICIANSEWDRDKEEWRYVPISSTITCNVIPEQVCRISVSNFRVKNYTKYESNTYTIPTTSCTVMADVTNSSGSTYNSTIGFYEGWYVNDGGIVHYVDPIGETLAIIAPGTTKTVEYTYTDLEENKKYRFTVGPKSAVDTWQKVDWLSDVMCKDIIIDTTTGIDNITTLDTNQPIYSLDGRRAYSPTPGIYIRGGKKFVVR